MSTEIRKTVRHTVPDLRYREIARAILGADFELSLVICGDKLAQAMNAKYRQKTYRPNVLSFPYGKKEGEIFLNIPCAKREARKYGVSLRSRMALLFVHGCFHLAGYKHGVTMERLEQKMLRKFNIS
jgi:probable rRNA maturation factor